MYGTGTFLFFAVIIFVPVYFMFFNNQPTCFDKIQNGFETGVDCSGDCNLVCSHDAESPLVTSSGTFRVQDEIYNSIVVIENKNTDFGAKNVSYKLSVVDSQGREYDKREGVINILPGELVPVFEPSMRVPVGIDVVDTKVVFGNIVWRKNIEPSKNINVSTGVIENTERAPFLSGNVRNNEPVSVGGQQIVALVSDDEGNPVGVSSTIVESLGKGQAQEIFFTWPEPFYVGSRICDAQSGRRISSFLGDVVIVVDRSGSMDDESLSPPEPLNTVKLAAIRFIRSLGKTDMAGIVSFANEASIDSGLSVDTRNLAVIADNINILESGIQHTNLADGLSKSLEILTGSASQNERKAVVLLTDGVATRPLLSGNPDYPQEQALEIAKEIRNAGVEIYVIGLGPDVDSEFLQKVVSQPKNYYGVERKESLNTIYDAIASDICSKKPAIVNTFIVPLE